MPGNLRTKEANIDGAKFRIGEITFDQSEDLFGEGKQATHLAIILTALNNARAEGEAEWTKERVSAEMGAGALRLLAQEVIDFSELKLRPAGEEKAAS